MTVLFSTRGSKFFYEIFLYTFVNMAELVETCRMFRKINNFVNASVVIEGPYPPLSKNVYIYIYTIQIIFTLQKDQTPQQ